MAEKSSLSPEEAADQHQLFGYGLGNHGDTDSVRYPSGSTESPEPAGISIPEAQGLFDRSADEMIEIALADRLDPDLYSRYDERRGKFIKEYNWTPYSEGEATAAIAGLPTYIQASLSKGTKIAAENVKNKVDSYRAQCVHDIETLREAQDIKTGEFIPDAARSREAVRQILARAVLARNSLDAFEWHRQLDKRSKERRENKKTTGVLLAITDKLASLEDEKVAHLCQKTLVHQQARLQFWTQQVERLRAEHEDLAAASSTNA